MCVCVLRSVRIAMCDGSSSEVLVGVVSTGVGSRSVGSRSVAAAVDKRHGYLKMYISDGEILLNGFVLYRKD